MKPVRKVVLGLSLVFALSGNVYAADCTNLNNAMKTAYDNANQMAIDQADQIMVKPDLSALDSCLGGLRGAFGGFSLPGLPDLSSLLSQICDAVVDNVYDAAMDGIGDKLDAWDITVYRTDSPGVEVQPGDITIREPQIDVRSQIDNLFN